MNESSILIHWHAQLWAYKYTEDHYQDANRSGITVHADKAKVRLNICDISSVYNQHAVPVKFEPLADSR